MFWVVGEEEIAEDYLIDPRTAEKNTFDKTKKEMNMGVRGEG